jgi:hypothetical protein
LKKSLVQILTDDEKLSEYVQTLEDDIDASYSVDEKVDLILDNILKKFDNFNDFRSLSAQKIESVTELLKLKSELPQKRIQTKKQILDIMSRKKELEIKGKMASATEETSNNANTLIKMLFAQLDNTKIHPIMIDDDKLKLECNNIIDTTLEKVEEPEKIEEPITTQNENIVVEEKKKIPTIPNEMNIIDLQSKLDSPESGENK